MHPVKLLKQDHRTVKGLFRKFESASKRSERQKIGQEIIAELSVHAAIEEQLVYPALRARDKRLEEAALNALEEHHAVKLVLLELDKMNADDERYDAKMHVVQESIAMHIEEEESKLLPRFDSLFEPAELDAMAEAMVAMKKVAPSHPHPGISDTPPRSIVAAMIARLNDTGKDMLRKLLDGDKLVGQRRVKRRANGTAAAMAKRSRKTAAGRGAAAH